MTVGSVGETVAEQLQDLVLDSIDVMDFLAELSEYSAALVAMPAGLKVECAVTLYRRRRSLTGAGSTARARTLNNIQTGLGEGPCLTALQESRTVLISDVASDGRWPEYATALMLEGIHSVLAVPLVLEQGAAASLNFFSQSPGAFTDAFRDSAERYASQAGKALRLAVRIGSKQQTVDDLQEAMKSRTTIDLAVGVIMGQQQCSQSTAFGILNRAASGRNKKLRDVAHDLLGKITDQSVETHFTQ